MFGYDLVKYGICLWNDSLKECCDKVILSDTSFAVLKKPNIVKVFRDHRIYSLTALNIALSKDILINFMGVVELWRQVFKENPPCFSTLSRSDETLMFLIQGDISFFKGSNDSKVKKLQEIFSQFGVSSIIVENM